MRRLAPMVAVLATISALLAADCAKALPLGSRQPPPWFEAGRHPSRSWPRIIGGGRAITFVAWKGAVATITELGDERRSARPRLFVR
jgi:hypothetical protein